MGNKLNKIDKQENYQQENHVNDNQNKYDFKSENQSVENKNNIIEKYEQKIKNNKKNIENNLIKNNQSDNKSENNTEQHLQLNKINKNNQNCQSMENKHSDNTLMSIGGSLFQDIRKIYKFKDVLGGGHFGTVRIAYKRNEEPRKYFAIKSISKKNLKEKDLKDLIKEVEIISNLDHPNIIKLFETYHDEYYFHIVMELCKGKEVFDKIIEEESISEMKVSKIIYKVLSAIYYCHTNGISHRDIKPENILFENTDPDADIKLIDFGLSRKYNSDEKMHTILGTPYYVAPEVLKGNYDEKCDLWSIGAITYIMLCGEPAFSGKSNNEIFKKIMNAIQIKTQVNKNSPTINFICEPINSNISVVKHSGGRFGFNDGV